MGKLENLIGKRFGKLLVIEKDSYRSPCGKMVTKWKCQCDCGSIKSFDRAALIRRGVKDCGCEKSKRIVLTNNLTGKTFGRLKVLKPDYKRMEELKNNNKRPRTYYICECECGVIKSIRSDGLTTGMVESCGCYHKEITKELSCYWSKKTNFVYIDSINNVVYILPVNAGNYFLIDIEDYEKIKNYCWREDDHGYMFSQENTFTTNKRERLGKRVSLSRLIMNCPDGMVVDHINHNIKDNRKNNLRIVTPGQNSMNKMPFEGKEISGVNFYDGAWIATIGYKRKNIYLGRYRTYEEAKKARVEAEEKYFGEFSYQKSI